MEKITILGIDNVFFSVGDVIAAIDFYSKLGFKKKFFKEYPPMALMEIGEEIPGLILKGETAISKGTIWVEIEDANSIREFLVKNMKIENREFETMTGKTIEIDDPWGNTIGFADYSKKRELSRIKQS